MRWLALLALVAVAGCKDIPQARSESEIERIAQRKAVEFTGPVLSRNMDQDVEIAELKRRIEWLEKDLAVINKDLRAVDRDTSAGAKDAVAEMSRLSTNEKAFKAQIDFLRARQGLSPMPTQ